MRVLITYGSKRGGTEGIAGAVRDVLRDAGHTVDLAPVDKAPPLRGYDAVIIGGALYAFRWHRAARRFVARHITELRRVPVWMFSSGPLDASADTAEIPPPAQVAVLIKRIGALGHVTFGGRLAPDAKGFPASAMAKTQSGDWRNWERIRAWATEVAAALPAAHPGVAIEPPERALSRLLAYAATGTVITTAIVAGIGGGERAPTWLAAVLAPAVFANMAQQYFLRPGARDSVTTALVFSATLAVAELALHFGGVMLVNRTALWLPVLLVAVVTMALGGLLTMRGAPAPART